MGRLNWDGIGKKEYSYGVSKGVLYLYDSAKDKWVGQVWNGLIKVVESPEGGEVKKNYSDNIVYSSIRSAERFKGTIEAYTTPKKWGECIGNKQIFPGMKLSGQARKPFCLVYREEVGNDRNSEYAYRIHVIYNAMAKAKQTDRKTKTNTVDVTTLSYEFTCTPVSVPGYKATSHLIIDGRALQNDIARLKVLEMIIYGTAEKDPWLPPPSFFLSMTYEDLGIFVLDTSALDSNMLV